VLVLVWGRRWWRASTGRAPTTVERAGLLVLGVRQLVQGLGQVFMPARLQRAWLTTDLAHASSMVFLALRKPSVARPALVSATVAAANAAWSLLSLRTRR
jgi:hypothetical protein